ncbi:ribonuclease-3 [Tessaracoccus bendigoensis DSM 12906]|uniref:Ribonuclease 3 n=1 Tax=Tessaracoccus bendigoensis DSM 12906 TaxID=1123357 RepID=A0A1M6BX85_9ACTN|nr:ribonuclease III [Tessaracoccus bendigoensis]SHI53114.1 ribonuclease-3 [Tessaracoccus bendigoensis DSM 12906]
MSRLQDRLNELGVEVDAQLFELSFTHRSFAYENGAIASNERLEFLGDAVLQIVVTEHIYLTYPDLSEGQLAKLRASVVSAVALAEVARTLDLSDHLRLGKGEAATKGTQKASILADTMEAVIGAVHLSAGTEGSARFVHSVFDPLIAKSEASGDYADHKTVLQELCAASGWDVPHYEVAGTGPDHQRVFTAVVIVDGSPLGEGIAPSKKRAEQIAARQAVEVLTGA